MWMDPHPSYMPRLPKRLVHGHERRPYSGGVKVEDHESSPANLVSRNLTEVVHDFKEMIKKFFLGRNYIGILDHDA